jgi:predicted transcriptional regulator
MTKEFLPAIQVRLPQETITHMQELAWQKRTTFSEIARQAIRAGLPMIEQEGKHEPQERKTTNPS